MESLKDKLFIYNSYLSLEVNKTKNEVVPEKPEDSHGKTKSIYI